MLFQRLTWKIVAIGTYTHIHITIRNSKVRTAITRKTGTSRLGVMKRDCDTRRRTGFTYLLVILREEQLEER